MLLVAPFPLKDCVIAYLPQHLMTEDGRTVFVLLHQSAKIYTHLLGILIHEAESFCFCLGTVVTLRTFEDERYERIMLTDITEELQTCIRTFFTTEGICAIL